MERNIVSKLINKKESLENKNHNKLIFITLIMFLIGLIIVSLMLGRYNLSYKEMIDAVINKFMIKENAAIAETILFNVRGPRIFTAVLVGGTLSIAGASYQSMFKNPMVSPDLLGVTSGAGFGAALALLLDLSFWSVQIFAFSFGVLAVFVTLTIGKVVSKGSSGKIIILILSGMIVGTLFKSFISITKYLADPNDSLPEITFWLMGSFSSVDSNDFLKLCIPVIIGVVPMILLRWKLNVMTFGEEEAKSLGIETEKIRILIIIASTIATSACISICGIIGWVGLIIPHITRMIVGPNNNYLIPTSLVIGGIYLLIVDNISRAVFPIEIPLGILTSIIGAPFFLYLLLKARRSWE